jgi:rhodanese-related sulfurtransferase
MNALVPSLLLSLACLLAQAQERAAATPPPPAAVTNLQPRRIIRAELLRTMLQRTNDFVLIDVSPALYYRDFHIKGAMSIPEPDLPQAVRDWPRSRRIVVYCLDEACESGRDATRTLMAMGFTDVLQYEGGKRDWHQKKYEAIGPGKLLD